MTNESDESASGESRGTKARLQEAWQSTLGKFATAEEGSRNMVHRLVEWGKLTGEEGKSLLTDWRKSIEDNRRQLEKRVEESVMRNMARFTLPTQRDLKNLTDQIAALEERVHSLVDKRTS